MLHLNKTILLAIGVAGLIITSCVKSFDEIHNDISTLMNTRSELKEPNTESYEVTQKMAELFISSNKDNPPIVHVEPFCKDDIPFI